MYNVMVVGKNFNKGCLVFETRRRVHTEELVGGPDGVQERIATAEERRRLIHLDRVRDGAVCSVFGHATSTRCSADVAGRGNPNQLNVRTNQPI